MRERTRSGAVLRNSNSGLALDASYDPQKLELTIELRNRSKKPVRVDGELVFGLTALPLDQNGSVIETQIQEGIDPRPPPEALAKRYVALAPGETICRTIDVRSGWKCFMVEDVYRGGSKLIHTQVGYEANSRPSEMARPTSFAIYYENNSDSEFTSALRTYTGVDSKDVGLNYPELKTISRSKRAKKQADSKPARQRTRTDETPPAHAAVRAAAAVGRGDGGAGGAEQRR